MDLHKNGDSYKQFLKAFVRFFIARFAHSPRRSTPFVCGVCGEWRAAVHIRAIPESQLSFLKGA